MHLECWATENWEWAGWFPETRSAPTAGNICQPGGSDTMKDQELENSLQVSDAGQPTAGEPALDLIEPVKDEASGCLPIVTSYEQNRSEAAVSQGQGWVTRHVAEGARTGLRAQERLWQDGPGLRCWMSYPAAALASAAAAGDELITGFPERPGFSSGASENSPASPWSCPEGATEGVGRNEEAVPPQVGLGQLLGHVKIQHYNSIRNLETMVWK